ncbi:MAG TPA: type 4a pilus biogenesis protein PilO [Candidatus Hydrogenedens sp.]|nr:type 4a pilus biogenesis protein PilO [Candidatus Hydrogenedens sp.]HOK09307.1 type 4a pilus biogenesis protein PilO [Candidatus Hydrogenedens sp.]HPP58623.1 type 4a pilus biogenesis protein PilO [Candidatus Hydrogenedens sp.]
MIDLFRGKITLKDWAVLGIAIAIVIGLSIGAYLFLFIPQQNKITTIQNEIKDLEKKIRDAKETVKNYDKLQNQAKKMDNLVTLFNERLPEKREVPKLMKQFENMGDSLGLKTQLTPLPTTVDASKEVIPYQVVAKGSFHQIVAFINLLEKDQRYLKISDLDIGPEKEGICEAKFVLSTFRFVEQEDKGTQEQKKS